MSKYCVTCCAIGALEMVRKYLLSVERLYVKGFRTRLVTFSAQVQCTAGTVMDSTLQTWRSCPSGSFRDYGIHVTFQRQHKGQNSVSNHRITRIERGIFSAWSQPFSARPLSPAGNHYGPRHQCCCGVKEDVNIMWLPYFFGISIHIPLRQRCGWHFWAMWYRWEGWDFR